MTYYELMTLPVELQQRYLAETYSNMPLSEMYSYWIDVYKRQHLYDRHEVIRIQFQSTRRNSLHNLALGIIQSIQQESLERF